MAVFRPDGDSDNHDEIEPAAEGYGENDDSYGDRSELEKSRLNDQRQGFGSDEIAYDNGANAEEERSALATIDRMTILILKTTRLQEISPVIRAGEVEAKNPRLRAC